MTWASLGLDSARELVDLKHARADSQLSGAVAIHNILQRERVAYLADEVGLGKTYVALATAALMRHFDPGFRVLVIAPRSNIQRKWTNDWRSFVSRNWVPTDLRVKAVSGSPARPLVVSERLVDLVHDVAIEPDTDVFSRLTSFSYAAVGDRQRGPGARTSGTAMAQAQRLPPRREEVEGLRRPGLQRRDAHL